MSEPSFRPPRTKPIRPLRLPYSEVPSVLTSLRESNAWPSPKLALEFAVLTATRSREVLGAPWDEMDLERALWTVPPHRTKSCLAHSVPLSGQALAVLAEARQLGDGEGLVFPNPRGGPLSASSLSALLRRHGIEQGPHSFRLSFREWCADTGVSHDVAEAVLGHCGRDIPKPKLREVLEAWGAYLSRSRSTE